MAYAGQMDQEGFYQTNYAYDDPNSQQQSTGYDMTGNSGYGDSSTYSNYDTSGYGQQQQRQQPGAYSGQIFTPDPVQPETFTNSFDDEPPLLEELGINFEHIYQKTLCVLNPLRETESAIISDGDLAGPLVFALLFGASLLLAGKIHFGYIYGIGGMGCLALWMLLNLMSLTGVSVSCIVSVIGYCLLPMVFLSVFSLFTSLHGLLGMIVSIFVICWCSFSASKLFVTALAMDAQLLLVAYPCALLYGVFALLALF